MSPVLDALLQARCAGGVCCWDFLSYPTWCLCFIWRASIPASLEMDPTRHNLIVYVALLHTIVWWGGALTEVWSLQLGRLVASNVGSTGWRSIRSWRSHKRQHKNVIMHPRGPHNRLMVWCVLRTRACPPYHPTVKFQNSNLLTQRIS